MKKKGPDRAAMDQLEAQDVTSFGEDPELLDPAEQALLDGGNAGDTQPPAPPEGSQAAPPRRSGPPLSGPLKSRNRMTIKPPPAMRQARIFPTSKSANWRPPTRFPHGHC